MSLDCIFCKIISREIPADIVYEDDQVLGFRDLSPQAPIHVLLIPKQHLPTLNDLGEAKPETLQALLPAAAKIARDQGVADSGYRLTINCGKGAGQTVFHLHLHLLAGRPFSWPPG